MLSMLVCFMGGFFLVFFFSFLCFVFSRKALISLSFTLKLCNYASSSVYIFLKYQISLLG